MGNRQWIYVLLYFVFGNAYILCNEIPRQTTVQVNVSEGILEGEVVTNHRTGKTFCSFKGIPYAQPPLGDLRFKAPQPKTPWSGVREAKENGNICHQFDVFTNQYYNGSEDCLYLNVYTPTITPKELLPVMFWIHGGAFVSGSGDDQFYGPHFLVNKDVVVVSINYRLEVLGFLSLDTEDIPGNAGMKDQVAALRWTHKNIANFGGDPNNITIFGESAGGVSTSYHCISPMSKGYFKRAIIMSGVSNTHWAQARKPRDRALALARNLGCFSEDDKELYEFFKNQPIDNLIRVAAPIILSEKAQTRIEAYFSVIDEKQFGDNERFFYGDIFDVLSNGIHDDIDILIGYTSDEGIINIGPTLNTYKERIDLARDFPEVFVSKPLSFELTINQQLEFGQKMRNYYFKNSMKYEDWYELTKFYAMDLFVFPTMQWVKSIASKGKHNIYLYEFNMISERNLVGEMIGVEDLIKESGRQFCIHSDDLAYLFEISTYPAEIEPETLEKIEKVTKMWTDFAKYGNPTPDDSMGVKWLPYTNDSPNYMYIGSELILGSAPGHKEQQFWTNLFKEYGQRVFE